MAKDKIPIEKRAAKKNMALFIVIALVFLTLTLSVIFLLKGETKCTDTTCFISEANKCETVSLTQIDPNSGATLEYYAQDCVFGKMIAKLSTGEDADLKTFLEGKSLTCEYEKDGFNPNWVKPLSAEGLEMCNGDLRDRIYQLLIFT